MPTLSPNPSDPDNARLTFFQSILGTVSIVLIRTNNLARFLSNGHGRHGYRRQMRAKLQTKRRSCTRVDLSTYLPLHNPFIVDVNTRVLTTRKVERKVMQRALLDTGSDINLISATAFQDVQASVIPVEQTVQTLGGATALVGQTCLRWSFISSSQPLQQPQIYSDIFLILARTEDAAFDMILGQQWISNHFDTFVDLVGAGHRWEK